MNSSHLDRRYIPSVTIIVTVSSGLVDMLNAMNDRVENYLPYGLSILVVIVVALFICIITLGTGLAYMHRHRDADRSLGKHRSMTSSSTYALAPVCCPDSQQTTTTDATGLTLIPQSPSKARTLPPRACSPSPRTCRRLQVVAYSPATMRRHKLMMDGGVDAVTTPRFNDDLDVWRTTRVHDNLSVLPPASLWTDSRLPLPPPPPPSTWQRCSCTAGPAPCTTTSPGRVRVRPPPSLTQTTTPPTTSFSTFKPSSPAGVETGCPITLRPERCGDAEQTRPCHAVSMHLHVKHDTQSPDNSSCAQQSTA